MNLDLLQEVLEEMGSSLVEMAAQNGALLQLLKNKGVVTEDELKPLVAEAGKAASVRWRAARIRLESQLNAEKDKEERARDKAREEAAAKKGTEKNAADSESVAGPFGIGQEPKARDGIETKKAEPSNHKDAKEADPNAAPPAGPSTTGQAGAGGSKSI